MESAEINSCRPLYYFGMPLDHLTDEELVRVVLEKDPQAYSEIIRRYEGKLTHYVRKFIRDPDERADVLQDIFIKTYRNLHSFKPDKKFSSWVYRIAHNESINALKKYAKEVVSLDEYEFEIIDKEIDVKKDTDHTILHAEIAKALAHLKPKFREPLILYFFEERSYDEISDILRIPRSTVGVLLLRGKKMLKDILDKHSYGKR